jgi:hypothetical protein
VESRRVVPVFQAFLAHESQTNSRKNGWSLLVDSYEWKHFLQ